MSTSTPATVRSHIENAVALAQLLQRVEADMAQVDANQYRLLALQLQAALAQEMPAPALEAILRACPSAAEIYENLHYGHAGLARAPLERSVASEQLATQVIARAAAKPAAAS
jgi:hypothetical protein